MTFCQEVKRELCRAEPKRECCAWAQLYGMLLFSRSFPEDGVAFTTESLRIAETFAQLMAGLTGAFASVRTDTRARQRETGRFSAVVEDPGQRELAAERFGLGFPALNPAFLENDCCVGAFFRGLFLPYGSVINPEREYHLELAAPNAGIAEAVAMLGEGRGIHWRVSHRKNTGRRDAALLYVKESEQVEDFLTMVGATKATLKLMDIKIMKELRNKVNRATNCETANLDKTVSASRAQVADIAYIRDRCGLSYLDEELRPLAQLRLDNPECSLRELADMLDPPLSRSGVNHRLKRIQQAAAALRAQGAEKGEAE